MACNDQNNENGEFKANLSSIKRKAPKRLGHMLPYYK